MTRLAIKPLKRIRPRASYILDLSPAHLPSRDLTNQVKKKQSTIEKSWFSKKKKKNILGYKTKFKIKKPKV